MFRRKYVITSLFIFLIALLVLVGCNKKTISLRLPNGVSLVDTELDVKKLMINSEVDFLITPEAGKELDTLLINGKDKTASVSENRFTVKIVRGLTIKVTFRTIVERVRVVLPSGVQLVDTNLDSERLILGSQVELKVVPPEEHDLISFKVGGEELKNNLIDGKITVTVVEGLTVSVEFKSWYTSLSLPNSVSLVDESLSFSKLRIGSTVVLRITPYGEQEVKKVLINGHDVTSELVNNEISVTVVEGLTMVIEFQNMYTSLNLPDEITLVVEGQEGLNPNKMRIGTTVWFKITPPEDFTFYTLFIDNEDHTSMVSPTTLEFAAKIVEGMEFSVSFKSVFSSVVLPNEISVDQTVVGQETLTPDKLRIGSNVSFKITPPVDQELDSLIINDENVTGTVSDNKFTATITEEMTINITFKNSYTSLDLPNQITIDQTVSGQETLTPDKVRIGSNVSFKITPPTDQELDTLLVNNEDITESVTDNKFVAEITEGMTFNITFKNMYTSLNLPNEITIDQTHPGQESLTPNKVRIGSNVFFKITPPENKMLDKLFIGETDYTGFVSPTGSFFAEIYEEMTFTITFTDILVSLSLTPNDGTITLTDSSLNPNAIPAGTVVEFLITLAPGRKVTELWVGSEDYLSKIQENNTFNVTIPSTSSTLAIVLIWDYINYTLTYSINNGMFTFEHPDQIRYNDEIKDTFIKGEVGTLGWKLNGNPVSFPFNFTYSENITLNATVNPLTDASLTYEAVAGGVSLTKITNSYGVKIIILPDQVAGQNIVSTKDFNMLSIFSNKKQVAYLRLPANLKTIGKSTFINESSLKSVIFPSELEVIGERSFYGSGLTEVVIPNTVTTIGNYAFSDSSALENVSFQENSVLTSIGQRAFARTAISSIFLANDADIGLSICEVCPNFENYEIVENSTKYRVSDGILFNFADNQLISYPSGKKDTVYTIPGHIQTLGDAAFRGAVYLERVNIPIGLTAISDYAFSGASQLKTIYISISSAITTIGADVIGGTMVTQFNIGKDVTTISSGAFLGARELLTFVVHSENTTFKAIDDALYTYNELTLVCVPAGKTGIFNVKDGTQVIQSQAFAFSKLETAKLPTSLKTIQYSAFYQTSMTYIIIPSSVTTIQNMGFYGAGDNMILNIYVELTEAQKPEGWVNNWAYNVQAIYWDPNWELGPDGKPRPIPNP